MADYGQLFCEAVDTIVQERLSGIKFDNTIVGIIVDDKDKAQGKYVVSYGQAKFEAYSLNDVKYNIHNNVYVQIPQGDWNEQKFIIGRKADDENVPVNYQYPFDSFIDITGNLLVNTPNITSGLIANGLYDNNELKKGSDSEIIWSYNIPKPSEDDTVERPFGEQFSKYTRLGI
jgi:Na+-transporting NADH:ubiquinone oxidoreductase subunit NqrF